MGPDDTRLGLWKLFKGDIEEDSHRKLPIEDIQAEYEQFLGRKTATGEASDADMSDDEDGEAEDEDDGAKAADDEEDDAAKPAEERSSYITCLTCCRLFTA